MMGDEQESHPLRLQAAHLREQALDLLSVQLSRRLVQDDESRPVGKGARNLDQLPGLDPKIAGAGALRNRDVPMVEHFSGVAPKRVPSDEAAPKRLPVDEEVFGDGEVRSDGRMLVDARDPPPPALAVRNRGGGFAL